MKQKKYLIGQKIKLKKITPEMRSEAPSIVNEMDKYFEKIVCISSIKDGIFHINEDNGEWSYNISWIDEKVVKLPDELFTM